MHRVPHLILPNRNLSALGADDMPAVVTLSLDSPEHGRSRNSGLQGTLVAEPDGLLVAGRVLEAAAGSAEGGRKSRDVRHCGDVYGLEQRVGTENFESVAVY
jgi:hypothetical protein